MTFRAAILLTILLAVCGSTTERQEVESLSDVGDSQFSRDLVNIDSRSAAVGSQSKLADELAGMVDAKGNSVLAGAANKTSTGDPPKLMSKDDLAAMTGSSAEAKKVKADQLAAKNAQPPKYKTLPFISFEDDAKLHQDSTDKACEALCDGDDKCKSFTFIKDTKKCWVSKSHMQYDVDFKFYVKRVPKLGGESTFTSLGGIKYDSSAMDTKCRASSGSTIAKCKELCVQDENCHSYTYRAKDQLCIRSSASVSYNQEAKYHEKAGVSQEGLANKADGKPPKDQGKEPELSADEKELKSKAALSPEQLKQLKVTEFDGTAEMQKNLLRNALTKTADKMAIANKKKVADAQAAAKLAQKTASEKESKEIASKSVYKKTLKENTNKMQESLETLEKSEVKARESGQKTGAKAKEASEKEKEKGKHSAACEKSQKNQESADLEDAKLQTEKGQACNAYSLAEKLSQTAKSAKNNAQGQVNRWEKDIATATQKLVYLAEKPAIKASEAKLVELQDLLDEQTKLASDNAASLEAGLAEMPDVEGAVAKAKSEQVKITSELDAAKLAIQGAVSQLDSTTAKAAAAASAAALAQVESTLASAEATLKRSNEKISRLQAGKFAVDAKVQGSKEALEKEKINLSALKQAHLNDTSNNNLKLGVARHQLPLAQDVLKKAKKDLETRQASKVTSDHKCKTNKFKVFVHGDKLGECSDEMTMCAAERKEKAAAKNKAEQEFDSQQAAFVLRTAKKREAHFIQKAASAKLQLESAKTTDEKIEAGGKLSDAQAGKVTTERDVEEAIPNAETEELKEGKQSAKESAAKVVEKKDKKMVAADTTKVDAEEKKVAATSKHNPTVIMTGAKKILATLQEQVGLAEIEAGEEDTTKEDMKNETDVLKVEPVSGNPTVAAGNTTAPTKQAQSLAQEASKDMAAGNNNKAAEEMEQAEQILKPKDPTMPPTTAPTEDPNAAEEEGKAILATVKAATQTANAKANEEAEKAAADEKAKETAAAEKKEVTTKIHIKTVQAQLNLLAKQEQQKAEEEKKKADGLSGNWAFAGSTAESIGTMGDATVKGTTWEKDDQYGKCLGFAGPRSQADLGDMKLKKGTIAFWVRIDEPGEQALFGPGMMPKAEAEQKQAAMSVISTSIQNTIRNAIKPMRRLLGEPADDKDGESAGSPAPPPEGGAAKGGVMIMKDGGVSIFDGTKSVSLSAAEVVPVGVWVQLVFTFLDNRVTLFVNGALQHTGDCATDYDGHPFIFGRGFKGAILNLDVWHRTLGVQEISKLPKPTNEASANEFIAHSHEGKYELAKRQSEDLARREIVQKQKMKAAEAKIKAAERETISRELADKLHEKTMQAKQKELSDKEKAREEAWEESKKERNTKEVSNKAKEDQSKKQAQANEQLEKNVRKQALEKQQQTQAKGAADAKKERETKAQARTDQLNAAKQKEVEQKAQENASKAESQDELAQKRQKTQQIQKSQLETIDKQNKQVDERQQKEDATRAAEVARSKAASAENAEKSKQDPVRIR